ncbi:hypothetical protein ACIHAX_37035 [Nocardia sp. NPDC051929]|uniref:hypothetical protein n=1 Tax=unclassified Nocardia TaxID=2637762 RepID=UPI0034342927
MGKFDAERLMWFPARLSSERMKAMVLDEFARRDIWAGHPEMWYSNLASRKHRQRVHLRHPPRDDGRGLVKAGDTLLRMVPESSRFTTSFTHFRAVSAAELG